MKFCLLALFVFAFSLSAEAKIFDLSKSKFGSYLLFSGEESNLKDTPLVGESAATSFSDTYKYPVGGEFGFMYTGNRVGFRFGVESMAPPAIEGNASSGNSIVYHYRNTMTVIAPKIGMEIYFKSTGWYRISGYGFFGQANLVSETDYSAAELTPGDHNVNQKSSASMYGGGLMVEASVFDNTTLLLEAGYRQLKFSNVLYSKDITTFNGTYSSGDRVVNADGTDRLIDFTGTYVMLGFRFYLF